MHIHTHTHTHTGRWFSERSQSALEDTVQAGACQHIHNKGLPHIPPESYSSRYGNEKRRNVIAHGSDMQKDNRRQGSLGKLSRIAGAGGEAVGRGRGWEGVSVPKERESVKEEEVPVGHLSCSGLSRRGPFSLAVPERGGHLQWDFNYKSF